MIKQDYRLNDSAINILKSFKGKKFDSFLSDNAFGGTKTFFNALFSVNKEYYSFKNSFSALDYYGNGIEDVALLSFDKATDELVSKEKAFERTIEIPIDQIIRDVEIVNEIQTLTYQGTLQYETTLTRGIIFHMNDGYEISFEKDIWFSEAINTQRGYKLLEKYNPVSEFEEDWTNGVIGQCVRNSMFL